MNVVAVVGISGVGKSTLISEVAKSVPLIHLQASVLIKGEQELRRTVINSSDELRLGAVLDNQELLISGFHRAATGASGLIIFDGHVLIDGRDGPVEIPASVFQALNCCHIAAIVSDPATIMTRRACDASRPRPLYAAATLAVHQDRSTHAARRVGTTLAISVSVHDTADIDSLKTLLRSIDNSTHLTF